LFRFSSVGTSAADMSSQPGVFVLPRPKASRARAGGEPGQPTGRGKRVAVQNGDDCPLLLLDGRSG